MRRALPLFAILLVTACRQEAPPDVEVTGAWARATAPGQSSAAAYAVVENRGGQPDRLTGAATDRTAMAMIHENRHVDGIARMRMVDQLEIPARGRLELKPGGTHIMIEGLKAPLGAGDSFELRLRFEASGEKTVPVTVVAAGAR